MVVWRVRAVVDAVRVDVVGVGRFTFEVVVVGVFVGTTTFLGGLCLLIVVIL